MKALGLRAYARHRAAAALPGATEGAVRLAIKSGRLAKAVTRAGKIRNAKAADAEWASSTKAEMVPLTGPSAQKNGNGAVAAAPPVNELAGARTRRETAVAELAEIELLEKRGELIRARDVEARLADMFLRCRARLLAVPVRAREHDPTLSTQQLRSLEALLHEALLELAGGAAV